ncbi:GNAT family N-acetyltransferase [Aquisalimonas sp.]|uniref:GNAT family N-acetyltransferase n=1 Tax=Aquisalimonas sp. TaxID=1872621 RepID=UPI0025BCF23C|nr:GNAT family N-acetyltransferase [Aquisalimonas sp.]
MRMNGNTALNPGDLAINNPTDHARHWPIGSPISTPDTARAELEDGTPVRLRLLDAEDSATIQAFFESLSPRSLHQRFHQRLQTLSPPLLRLLCGMDGQRHVAVGAFADAGLIGIGRFVCSAENARTAEVAFSVADSSQGRGLGKKLLRALAMAASERGVDTFLFTVLADNRAATRLLTIPGSSSVIRGGQLEGRVNVADVLR